MKPPASKSSNSKPSRGANANATATPPGDETEPADDTLTVSMFTKALDSLKSDICSKIEVAVSGIQEDIAAVREELTHSVAALQRSVDAQDGRIKEVEKSATATSDSVTTLETIVKKLQSDVSGLQAKCEDLESRSRKNNLRLVGIPEGLEGTSPTEFISGVLQKVLRLEEKPLLDRAHRSLRAKPRSDQPPRPFIIRVHYFHIRELILRQARLERTLSHNGQPIHIFPDLTASEAKRRAAFGDVRKRLRDIQGARFGFLYPARFRITLPGISERSFTDPQLAMNFVTSSTPSNANRAASDDEGI